MSKFKLNEKGFVFIEVIFLAMIVSFTAIIVFNGLELSIKSNRISAIRMNAIHLANARMAEIEAFNDERTSFQIPTQTFLNNEDLVYTNFFGINGTVKFAFEEKINPPFDDKHANVTVKVSWTVNSDKYGITSEDNNNETTSAKVEVEKLISSLISLENGTVDGIDENLASKIREKVNNGETIKVDVVTSDIKAEDVAEDAEKVNTKISGTSKKIAAYFDIDVLVKTATESLGNVTNLKDKITLEVKLPSNLPALKTGYQRSYKVIRVHNGVAEELDTKLSGDKVVFSSDRFSTYALTYEDTKITKNPETGDNIIPYIGLLIVSMVAFGVSMKKRK